jgi:UDP-N-acetylmuramoyl-L-alanyl-D-glutamate--2,6-diaminopimelate ligase
LKTLAGIITSLQARRIIGGEDTFITHVCYDSRLAQPGSLFVALRGSTTDGHRYLKDALDRGAVAALVEECVPDIEGYDSVVQVDDTRAALAIVASAFYDHPVNDLGIIGITGTNGKTTTTFMTEALLRSVGLHTGLVGSVELRVDNQVVHKEIRQTTPESLTIQQLLAEMRDSDVDWAVLEVTSHALCTHRVDACPFDIGVVTNVTYEHMEFHENIDEYRQAKARLLARVASRGDRPFPSGLVLNADDEGTHLIKEAAGSAPVIWYSSRGRPADVRASDISLDLSGTSFRLDTPAGSAEVQLRLLGRVNVDNALAAAGVGYLLGMSPTVIAQGLNAIEAVPGRMQRVTAGQPFEVIVDYAHTPDALEQILHFARARTPGKLISVFGSCGDRDPERRAPKGEVGARIADFMVLTSEDPCSEEPEEIIAQVAAGAIAEGAREGRDFICIEDRREAIRTAIQLAEPGDTITLTGKGSEPSMIYGREERPWNEFQEALRLLGELGYAPNMSSGKADSDFDRVIVGDQ